MALEPAAVRGHTNRIIASPEFAGVPRLQRFLSFVVETSLAGRASEIKETRVAVEVYGRPPTYNPQQDATVRVEAGRLRARLKRYYEGSGRHETIRITLPRGTYAPAFQSQPCEIFSPPPTPTKQIQSTPAPQSIPHSPKPRPIILKSAMKHFTPSQITVLQALAAGATVTAAAQLASVSRPTVYHWCDDPAFQQALAFAEQEHALTIQDRLQDLRVKALDRLEQVLDNPKSSPSVILRASVLLLTHKNWNLPLPATATPAPEQPHFTKLDTNSDSQPPTPRNAKCPCGSGEKYKRCCGKNAPPVLHNENGQARPAANLPVH